MMELRRVLSPIRGPLVGLLFLLAGVRPLSAEILMETGTLRGFLAGEATGCAYDNWISHVSENVARPGYNAYAPPQLDPQLNGFGGFQLVPADAGGDSLLALFGELTGLLLDDQGAAAALRLEESPGCGYQLAQLSDSSLGRDFWLLREALDSTHVDPGLSPGPQDDVVGGFVKGWGVFVFNPAATRPELCVEMPHPCDDFPTPYLGLEAFLALDAGLLLIHGAGREVAYTGSAAAYTNSASLSDPSRNCRLPFAAAHTAFLAYQRALGRQELVLQLHSYDDLSHRNLTSCVLTAGPSNRIHLPVLFDPGGGSKGLLGNLGQPVFAADSLGWTHGEWRLQDYVSSNSLYPVLVEGGAPDSLVQIPAAGSLPGYGANCQLTASYGAGYAECDNLERILHLEVDELPAPAHGLGAAAYYGCGPDTVVAALGNFAAAWAFQQPWVRALRQARDSLAVFDDSLPPTAPAQLTALQLGPTGARLSWQPSRSVFFDTYEVHVDTALVIGPGARVVTRSNSAGLCWPGLRGVDLTGLTPGLDYSLVLRARDAQGRVSGFSNSVRLHVVDQLAPVVELEERRLLRPGEATLIRARVTDHSPLAAVTLRSSADSLEWTETPMTALGDGWYEGLLAPGAAGESRWYQVRAEDQPADRSSTLTPLLTALVREPVARLDFDDAEQAVHAAFGGGSDQWRREACLARAGLGWRFGGAACTVYAPSGAAWLELEPLTIPDGLLAPVLAFWSRLEAEVSSQAPDSCYDGGLVQWRTADGQWQDATLVPAAAHFLKSTHHVPLVWPQRLLSGTHGWRQHLLQLPEGLESLELRLGFVCDANTHKLGWAVDELELGGLLPALPPAPRLELVLTGAGLRLDWRPVAGAGAYRVEQAALSGDPLWTLLATTTDCGLDVALASATDARRFRVTALAGEPVRP